VVMLDEPTAALGVAQTAQVLDLIERLRDRGLGVILISHNLADVKAVADRVAVLRLGRNAGEFNMAEATQEEIVQAITGASAHGAGRRKVRSAAPERTMEPAGGSGEQAGSLDASRPRAAQFGGGTAGTEAEQ